MPSSGRGGAGRWERRVTEFDAVDVDGVVAPAVAVVFPLCLTTVALETRRGGGGVCAWSRWQRRRRGARHRGSHKQHSLSRREARNGGIGGGAGGGGELADLQERKERKKERR
jgi:hypothetical protein